MSTSSNRFSSRFKAWRPARGFTVIELLVVSLIIAIITGFVLFRQQGFNSSTLLRSLAYSVALSVRQAQVYGVSVRESSVGSGSFARGYGVHFGTTGLLDTSHYLIFADTAPAPLGDGQYTSGEELPRFTLGNGRGTDYYIYDFCAHRISTGVDECRSAGGAAISSLTIFFRRPNPDACFSTSSVTSACAPNTTSAAYSYAYIQVASVGSPNIRTIKVSSTGQIAVCKLGVDPAAC